MKRQTTIVVLVIVVVAAVVAIIAINPSAKGDCEEADVNYRTDKDGWIIEPQFTPFDPGQITRFKGLDYYPIDCKYVVNGTLEKKPQLVDVPTSDTTSVQLTRYGIVTVTIKKKDYSLEIYKAGNLPEFKKFPKTYFIPFWDETALLPDTAGTFEKGRYLIVEIPDSGKNMELDFNMATNSWDAYNGIYSSIIVPDSNILAAPLAVGERKYEDRSD